MKIRIDRQKAVSLWKRSGFYILAGVCAVCACLLAVRARQRVTRIPDISPVPPVLTDSSRPADKSLDQNLEAAKDQPLPGWPVSGREILTPYSSEELIWSDTLCVYRTHEGVDIGAVMGETVAAAMDGQVTAAYADPLMGYTVEITHQDGLITRYSNLSTLRMVEVGQQIARGEPVGAVGDSAAAESGMQTHLHFEAWRDGEWVALPEEET